MYVRSTLDFEDSTDCDQPRARRCCLNTSPNRLLIMLIRIGGVVAPIGSSLQFCYRPVEQEVRADLQAFSNREQHRQRWLTARGFEQRGIVREIPLRKASSSWERFLRSRTSLRTLPNATAALRLRATAVTMLCTGLVLYGP